MKTKTIREMVDLINNQNKYNTDKSKIIVENYYKELQETLDKIHKGNNYESKKQ